MDGEYIYFNLQIELKFTCITIFMLISYITQIDESNYITLITFEHQLSFNSPDCQNLSLS